MPIWHDPGIPPHVPHVPPAGIAPGSPSPPFPALNTLCIREVFSDPHFSHAMGALA